MNPANNRGGHSGYGKPYTLSAAAPEFVPRFMAPTPNGMGMNPGAAQMMYQQQAINMVPPHHMSDNQMAPHIDMAHMGHQMPPPHLQVGAHPGQSHNDHQQIAAPGGMSHPGQMNVPQHSHYMGGHMTNPGHQQHQGGYSGGQQNYQPRQRHHQPRHQGSSNHSAPVTQSVDPMQQLKQSIMILTKDPGSFDELMPHLTSTIGDQLQSEEKLIQMVEEIFRQSVEEANFRYNGARICNYFSHHLSVNFPSGGTFRQFLLKRCHEEHKKREDLVKNCDIRYKLVGFTLFMAELLLNLTDYAKVGESSDYMDVIAAAVTQLVTTFLTQQADDTLRCVVQVLKLCGGVLEETEQSISEKEKTPDQEQASDASLTPQVDNIFTILKSAVLVESFIKSLRAQILSVIELRASNWGRVPETKSSRSGTSAEQSSSSSSSAPAGDVPSQPNPYSNQVPNNPGGSVYGGPNPLAAPPVPEIGGSGAQFSDYFPDDLYCYSSGEEDFLQGGNPEDYNAYMNMYNGVECVQEDEMEPEIAAAFEEFLLTQQQQQ